LPGTIFWHWLLAQELIRRLVVETLKEEGPIS
jgi:hypothetical protein